MMQRTIFIMWLALVSNGCSIPILLTNPDWEPSVLSKQGCPGLEGKYLGLGVYIDFLDFYSQYSKDKPWRSIKIQNLPHDYWSPYNEYNPPPEEIKKLNLKSRTLILTENKFPVIYAADDKGEKYVKLIINFNDPRIGCHNNSLIFRKVSSTGGYDFTTVTKMATEKQFHKLINGNLEVISRERKWIGNVYQDPKITETRRVYDAVN